MPEQFNKKISPLHWYSITYQSNDILNESLTREHHMLIKPLIAKILFDKIHAANFHSYIHGTIIFTVKENPLQHFDTAVNELLKPLTEYSPKLLFSLVLPLY